jgi:nucleotide-binding universal stress UspA family protein
MAPLYSTIVVGTDGSSDATQALLHAGELAQRNGTEKIHIVTAVRKVGRAEVLHEMDQIPTEFHAEPDLYASERYVLEQAAEMMEPYGIPVQTHLVGDRPASALIEMAEKFDADLIVVGSHGYNAGKRLFLGSVSSKVVHHAHHKCNVLVVSCDPNDD